MTDWTPEKIRQLRREGLRMTQEQLAAVLGVHRNEVIRWEAGKVSPHLGTQVMLDKLEQRHAG